MLGQYIVWCCWSHNFILGIARCMPGEVSRKGPAWGEPCVALGRVGSSLVTGTTEGSSSGCDIARLSVEDGREGETLVQSGEYSNTSRV